MNKLIQELPTITELPQFCACLDIDFGRCQQIQNDKPMNVRKQLIEVVSVWYHQSHDRNWEDIVEALICHEKNRIAVELAKKVGVNWKLLQSKKRS